MAELAGRQFNPVSRRQLHDDIADLAIGVPGEDITVGQGNAIDAGAVNVIYGTSAGLSSSADQLWDQGASGVPGTLEVGDGLGMSLY